MDIIDFIKIITFPQRKTAIMKLILLLLLVIPIFMQTVVGQDRAYISPNTNMNIGMDAKTTFNIGTMAGQPFQVNQFDNIKGSPYFIDSFSNCYFTLSDGKTYTGIKMRLNLFSNELHFVSKDSVELVASKGIIKRIAFRQQEKDSFLFTTFGSGYPAIDNNDAGTYYEELSMGKVVLLKITRRILQNQRLLTSSPLDKEFTSINSFYVLATAKWKNGQKEMNCYFVYLLTGKIWWRNLLKKKN